MLIETLESRCLFSASLNATTGLLTVTGTNYSDRINAFKDTTGHLIIVQSTFIPGTASTPARVVTTRNSFDITKVKHILVNALGGNDAVNLAGPYLYPVATTSIVSRLPAPLAIPSTINGGEGNDNLTGGNGADQINGGAGNDHLYGLAGNDTLNGNDGNDYLNGGAGADYLNGNAGNDYIWAVDGAATDHIDGGSNNTAAALGDIAYIDKGDSVVNVEKVYTVPLPLPWPKPTLG